MRSNWKSLLVDDEPLARERLKRLLAGFGNTFHILGEAENGDSAQEMIETIKPDIVFLDIMMPGKNVFVMLQELNHRPFIIFCTAYDHYALQAFQSNSVDYLVKPIEAERLAITVEKLRKIAFFTTQQSYEPLLEALRKIDSRSIPTSIAHKFGDKTVLIKLDQVVYFESDNKYTNFFDALGKTYFSDQSLKFLEENLPENFVRVSKSNIINSLYIKEIHKYFRGKVLFVMNDQKQNKIISGNGYSDAIKSKIIRI